MSYMVSDLRAQVSNGDLEDAVTATLSNSKAYTDIKFVTLQGALATKANIESPTFTGTVSGITKAMVGLSNVDNVSDVNKPINTNTERSRSQSSISISNFHWYSKWYY